MSGNKIVKASIWYTLSSFLLKGIGFITTPIFSRILTQEEYGIVNNFNAWLAIIAIIGTLSLSASLVRARFDYKEELNSFIKSNLLCGTLVTIFIFLIIYLNISFWEQLFVLDKKYFVIMCLTIMVNPAYDMFIQVQRFNYKYKLVTALSVVVTLTNVGVSLLFIFLFEDNLYARILGGQLPIIVVGLCLYLYFGLKGGKIKLSYLKYSVPMCIPFMVHSLSGTLLNSSDRAMITNLCGATDNALYSMAYNIALIVSVIWSAMNSAFSPWLGEKLNEKKYGDIMKYVYPYTVIFCVLVVGVMLTAPEVLWILGGQSYIAAKYVIPPVMVGYVFVFMYSLYVNIEQFEKKTLGMSICTLICAFINIGLNCIFIPIFGYIAAAYTTLVSYLLMYILHYFIVRHMRMQQCYDTRFLVGSCIAMVCLGALSLFLYINNLVRYITIAIFILAFLLIFIKKRHAIIKMLSIAK